MRVEQWRVLVFTSMLILGIITVLPFINLTNSNSEQFLAIGLLNSNGRASNYLPRGSIINQLIEWQIYVSNEMSESSLLSLRVKLLNSTMNSPNSTTCIPSQGILLYEKQLMLPKGGEQTIPFTWKIDEIIREEHKLTSITVNDIDRQIDLDDQNATYKLIFELWRYDSELNDFSFKWSSYQRDACSWAQIVFIEH